MLEDYSYFEDLSICSEKDYTYVEDLSICSEKMMKQWYKKSCDLDTWYNQIDSDAKLAKRKPITCVLLDSAHLDIDCV